MTSISRSRCVSMVLAAARRGDARHAGAPARRATTTSRTSSATSDASSRSSRGTCDSTPVRGWSSIRGTVIHPTGMTPQNGMQVRVFGHVASDGAFAADEIDVIPPRLAATSPH